MILHLRFSFVLLCLLSFSVAPAERRAGWHPYWAEQGAKCQGEEVSYHEPAPKPFDLHRRSHVLHYCRLMAVFYLYRRLYCCHFKATDNHLITLQYSLSFSSFSFFFPQVVAKKRRDRGLPRAFEIFTDSKTYVLKAQDEKHAEEWLQCINVAVAQARERENREATTYLWERQQRRWLVRTHTVLPAIHAMHMCTLTNTNTLKPHIYCQQYNYNCYWWDTSSGPLRMRLPVENNQKKLAMQYF